MKTKFKSKLISILFILVMVLALAPMATFTAFAYSGTIQNLQLNNGILTWDAFTDATDYYILIVGEGGNCSVYSDGETTINLETVAKSYHFETGEYEYKIYAEDANGDQISEESVGIFTFTNTQIPLDTPTNLRWEHTTAKWNVVEGNVRYYTVSLYEYNEELEKYTLASPSNFIWNKNTTYYDFGTMFEVGKSYCFDVRAYVTNDDLEHTDSEVARSEPKTFYGVVGSLTNVVIDKGQLSFDNVPGAYKYEINIATGGGSYYALPINLYDLCSGNNLEDGIYDIEIRVYNEYNEPLVPKFTYANWEYDHTLAPAKLTGTAQISGTLEVGETLTATLNDTNNTGVLTYFWYRSDPDEEWVSLQSGISNTYTIEDICVNRRIIVIITSDEEISQVQSAETGLITEAFTPEILNGTVVIQGDYKYGETLTVNVTSNNTGTLSYQWTANGVNIVGATEQSYTLTANDIGKVLRVVVTSSVETGNIQSDATTAIDKADGASAPIGITATDCTTNANNDGTISGVTTAMEYKIEDGDWITVIDTTISNLSNGTYYVRIKETATHKASEYTTVVVNGYETPTFDVSFDANGGDGTMDAVTIDENGTYELPNCSFTAPTGYEFKCWSVNATEKEVGDEITITADTTVLAVWKAKSYTITFDTLGGSVIAPITQDYGTTVVAPSNPTKADFIFTGWDKQIPATMPAENMTITAQWTEFVPNTYTVIYTDGVDGNEIFAEQITANIIEGTETPIFSGTPMREGYTFDGWSPSVSDTVTEDVTYTATWIINKYTITFDTLGGSVVAPITQDYGTNIVIPSNPTKTGYTFAGWDKEIPTTILAEDITITATWTINQYTITFDTLGGSEVAPITQNYGTDVVTPSNPTKTGYTFAGWDKEIPTTILAENITITATWTINQYTITFDTLGGSVIAPITQDYGTNVVIPSNPTKTGYTFAGWDKEIPTVMPAEDVTITAQWTPVHQHADVDGEWESDGTYHWHTCSCSHIFDKVECSGGTATCTNKAVCSVCNNEYGSIAQHNYGTAWEKDANEHWNECVCGDKANKVAHTDENSDGKCDVCDYQMSNETPNNPDEPSSGLSAGAIAGIVVGGVFVLGIGGFAIFWFIIKKKSFADIIAAFKKK